MMTDWNQTTDNRKFFLITEGIAGISNRPEFGWLRMTSGRYTGLIELTPLKKTNYGFSPRSHTDQIKLA